MNNPLPPDREKSSTPMAAVFLRIFWMLFGPLGLVAITAGLWVRSSEVILW
jgi:hypothetical protein